MMKKTTLLSLLAMSAIAQGDGFGDIADSAIDSADDAADEGAAIADGAFDDAAAIAADAEGDAVDAVEDASKAAKTVDTGSRDPSDWRYWNAPELWIGIAQCVGVLWWVIWGHFVYIKTNTSDDNVQEWAWESGTAYDAIPIGWFWTNLAHPTKGYTAMTYLFIWLFYLIDSIPAVVFWIWSLVEAEEAKCEGISGTWLFKIWSEWVGLYGSWILYFVPVLMPILQMGQINGDIFAPGWINAIVQVSMMTLTWLGIGLIHIFFVPALNQQWTDKCETAAVVAPAAVVEEVVEVVDEVEPEVDDGHDWD
jgi:hypothetical protein